MRHCHLASAEFLEDEQMHFLHFISFYAIGLCHHNAPSPSCFLLLLHNSLEYIAFPLRLSDPVDLGRGDAHSWRRSHCERIHAGAVPGCVHGRFIGPGLRSSGIHPAQQCAHRMLAVQRRGCGARLQSRHGAQLHAVSGEQCLRFAQQPYAPALSCSFSC